MGDSKECSACGMVLGRDDFHRNAVRVDGLSSICRGCQRKRDAERRAKYLARADSDIEVPEQQRCGECGEVKSVEAFSRNRGKKNGLSNSCRQCKTLSARERRARNAARLAFQPVPEKKCSKCHQVKPAGQYALCRGAACGLQGMCRDCSRLDAADRRRNK